MRLGERLVKDSVLNEEQIKEALEIQQRTGGRLGDILLAMTSMRAIDYYKVLAEHFHLPFANLLDHPVDKNLLTEADKELYLKTDCVPIKKVDGHLVIATANPSSDTFVFIKEHWGNDTHIVCTSRYDILHTLQQRFEGEFLNTAINSLLNANAILSSKHTLTRWQLLLLVSALGWMAYWMGTQPIPFFVAWNLVFMLGIGGIVFYKVYLSIYSLILAQKKKKQKVEELPSEHLPIYSILIPLYNENEITLRNLFLNIQKIDYPRHLLDIKILVEEDDPQTINILKEMRLPTYFEFIYVPPSNPRTKAKACNYGLRFVRGEYVALYDAEDKPDPLQLRIALQTFRKYKHEKLACVQGRLNFYNSGDNWLTKMFSLEYSYWFDLLLPALEKLQIPIPLGGTSNHFLRSVLWELHAWDPYNVTEDADLGVRLTRMGYTTRILSSVTLEEANCKLINWIRQRTRWVKGYIQTYLVHMRKPILLWRTLGSKGFLGFQLFIGGTILTNLCNLPLWIIFILSFVPVEIVDLSFLYPPPLYYLAVINFVVGSVGIIFLNFLGIWSQKKYKYLLVSLTTPFYWLLMSIASYRALFQLIFKPSVWEKTEHGISKTLN